MALVAAKRMLAMGGAWSLVGVAIGVNTAVSQQSEWLAVVSHAIAGILVLFPLGALLALVGGKPVPSWMGAFLGAVMAALIGETSTLPWTMQVNVGAVMGGLVGATLWPWMQMTVYLYGQVRSLGRS